LIQVPAKWTSSRNPPFTYFLFYVWANIQSLNTLRASLGLNTFVLKPICGEVGTVDHLVSGFLLCDGITQGLMLD
jgi:AMP deaminase